MCVCVACVCCVYVHTHACVLCVYTCVHVCVCVYVCAYIFVFLFFNKLLSMCIENWKLHDNGPLVVIQLLEHENKLSVLNFVLRRTPFHMLPIKSKVRHLLKLYSIEIRLVVHEHV